MNSDVIAEIAAERHRQVEAEGWTPDHDDQHEDGELLSAAVFYLWHGTDKAASLDHSGVPIGWPWEVRWWKPKDRRRNLIRAGALCLAEKERLERANEREVRRNWRSSQPSWACPPMLRSVTHVDHKLNLIVAEIGRLDRAAPPTEGGD